MPEFNPLDSDEEDEFDAMSNVTVGEPRRLIEDAPRRLTVMGVSQDARDSAVVDMTVNDSDQETDRAGVLSASPPDEEFFGPVSTGFVEQDTKSQEEGSRFSLQCPRRWKDRRGKLSPVEESGVTPKN